MWQPYFLETNPSTYTHFFWDFFCTLLSGKPTEDLPLISIRLFLLTRAFDWLQMEGTRNNPRWFLCSQGDHHHESNASIQSAIPVSGNKYK